MKSTSIENIINEWIVKICTRCNIEKSIEDFYNKYTEFKVCNSNRSLKRYHENKKNISNQKKYLLKKMEINYYKNKIIDM